MRNNFEFLKCIADSDFKLAPICEFDEAASRVKPTKSLVRVTRGDIISVLCAVDEGRTVVISIRPPDSRIAEGLVCGISGFRKEEIVKFIPELAVKSTT